MMIGQEPIRQQSNIAEIIQESRGKEALAVAFPKTKDLNDQLGPVTVFADYRQAADYLVAEMYFDYVQCMIDNRRFDWKAWNPVIRLMHFNISVKARGRADAVGLGSPPQNVLASPPKRPVKDRIMHPFRRD